MKKCIYLCLDEKQVDRNYACLLVNKEFRVWESRSGAEADYYRLSHYYGVKIFWNKSDCLFSCKMQKQISKTGRAPEVLGKAFPIEALDLNESIEEHREKYRRDGCCSWGYITEHVRVFNSSVCDSVFYNKDDSDWEHKYWVEAQKMIDTYFSRYYGEYDCHCGNFGVNSKGKVVMIDFGELSFS